MFMISAAVLLVVVAAGLSAFLVYRSHQRAERASEYRKTVQSQWAEVADQAAGVVSAMDSLGTPADLDILSSSASKLADSLKRIRQREAEERPPAGYARSGALEEEAARAMQDYVTLVGEVAASRDIAEVQRQKDAIGSRAAKARRDLTDFTAAAPFVRAQINGDFYQAATLLANAFAGPATAGGEAERKAVYDALDAFMVADAKHHDGDAVWSLLSGKLHATLAALNTTREQFVQSFNEAASGSSRPTDYYISRDSITFQSPDSATARAIVYFADGAPRIGDVGLVREPDGWKIDSFPFPGIL